MNFEFNDLPYDVNALEPHIDQLTMEIHHVKHHRAYYDNFIKAIKDTKQATWDLTQIFTSIASLPNAVRNNAGGYYNHNFFWKCMHPRGMHQPTGKLSQEVDKKFGGYEALKKVDDCRWNGALWLRFCVVDYQFGWQS